MEFSFILETFHSQEDYGISILSTFCSSLSPFLQFVSDLIKLPVFYCLTKWTKAGQHASGKTTLTQKKTFFLVQST